MNYQHELQEKKIAILKEIASTSIYSMQKSTELHCEYEKLTKDQIELLLVDVRKSAYPMTEPELISLLMHAFALGKKEQASIYHNQILK